MNTELDSLGKPDSNKADPIRIWLVDDDHDYCDLQAQLLNGEPGIKCQRIFHSAEGLLKALALETLPDVILLDVQMPGMSGLQAMPQIQLAAPKTKVLIMTTFFDARRREQALASGAASFLRKNIAANELVMAIYRACRPAVRFCSQPNQDIPLSECRVV